MKDEESGADLDPPLTFAEDNDRWVPVAFPLF